jgi:hypothetical protein
MAGTHTSSDAFEPSLFLKSLFTSVRHELRKDEEISQSTDRQSDPAAATATLAAEAALLEGRLSLLREAIETVDARIHATSETLRRLQLSVAGSPDNEAPAGREGGARLDHSTPGRA